MTELRPDDSAREFRKSKASGDKKRSDWTESATGSIHIQECSAQGSLEIREDQTAATSLTCEGFGPNQDVSWQLIKNDTVKASSTCGPRSMLHPGGQCDSTTSDTLVQRISDMITYMLITKNRRELLGNVIVRCLAEDVTNVASCKINVISPAVLSHCEVTMTTHQTLAGTCNFINAYSSDDTYFCIWTLTPTDRQGDPYVFPGVIHKTSYMESGKLYYKGTCSFTSSGLPPGHYSYTVRFFPGDSDSQRQGTVTVIGKGSTHIPECSAHGWLEAHEDQTAATSLTCEGFGHNQNVSWQLIKNNAVRARSTCGPRSTLHAGGQCDTSTSAIVVQRISDTTTSLFITKNRRQLVGNGIVRCLAEDVTNDASCKINVITPAVLSDCKVTMTTDQTLAGTCNFNNAYSSNGTYTCTLTLTPAGRQGDPKIIIPGVIRKTRYRESGKLYYKGTCSFTSSGLPPGDYFYTVRFFPGDSDSQHQGTVTVTETITSNPEDEDDNPSETTTSNPEDEDNPSAPAVLSDFEVTMTTDQTLAGTCNFRNAYSSNGTYTCTWTLTPTDRQGDPKIIFPGVVHKTRYRESSRQYYNGTCSLTPSELPPGDYSYNVRFFPGDSDSQHQGIVTVTDTPTSNPEGVPLGPLIGSSVAAVVVFAVIVAMFVILRKLWTRISESIELKISGHGFDKRRSKGSQQYISVQLNEENWNTGLNDNVTVGQPASSTSHGQGSQQYTAVQQNEENSYTGLNDNETEV